MEEIRPQHGGSGKSTTIQHCVPVMLSSGVWLGHLSTRWWTFDSRIFVGFRSKIKNKPASFLFQRSRRRRCFLKPKPCCPTDFRKLRPSSTLHKKTTLSQCLSNCQVMTFNLLTEACSVWDGALEILGNFSQLYALILSDLTHFETLFFVYESFVHDASGVFST